MEPMLLQSIVNAIITAATSKAGALVAVGISLLSALLFLMITWQGVKGLIEGASFFEHLGSFIGLTFTWGIAMFFLGQYSYLLNNLNSGFDYIINTLTGSNEPIYGALTNFFTMAGNIFKSTSEIVQDIGMTEIFTMLPSILTTLIFNAITASIILIAGLIYFIVYATAQVLFAVGAILGPVLIPWLLLPAAKDYFSHWLQFMVTAGMLKVVASVLAMVSGPAIIEANKVILKAFDPSKGIIDGNATAIIAGLTGAAIAALVAYLMFQTHSITSSLLPGHVGGSIWRPSMKMGVGGKQAAPKASPPSSAPARMGGSGQANAIDRAIRSGDKQGVAKSLAGQARAARTN